MERRVRGNSHARCGVGERLEMISKTYLSLLLCFDSTIDAESFAAKKSSIFQILPEEDQTKNFLAGLMIQTLSRELFSVADEHDGKLPCRAMSLS